MWWTLFLLVGILVFGFWLWFQAGVRMFRDVGFVRYTVLERRRGYEIREYESFVAMEVSPSGGLREAVAIGFSLLSERFSDSDAFSSRAKGGFEGFPEHRCSVAFPVSDEFLDSRRASGGEEVSFRVVPSRIVAALPFRWSVSEKVVAAKRKHLFRLLSRDGVEPLSMPDLVLFCPPDAPFFLIRGEMLVEV